jgi:putative heme-binding domain-containing protein
VAIVKPAKLQPQLTATTVETALQKLPTADVRRGERLFFNQADCAKCHRIGDRGNAFAPQLSDIGTRATAKAVAESILQPSAVITEGFHSIAVLTEDGQVHNGFIKQESGLSIQLVQPDGNVITIAKDSIEQRKRQLVSAMPSGMDKQLSPQQVADLIRFITETRKDTPAPANTISQVVAVPMSKDQRSTQRESNTAPLSLDPTTPITIRDNGRDLLIQCGDKEVATYIYRHDQVQRPFFAHVKAPSGTQLTRNFPPSAGDSKDHADMHPGLWMAFGDISGEDFWRNKGRVVHEKFVEKPIGGPGRGSFLQRKSYQRSDGSVVCVEDFRCTIHVLKEGYLVDWHSTFSMPPNSDKQSTEALASDSQDQVFYFGDQEEMGIGIRVATPITEKNSGQITDSKGRKGAKRVWSQSSAWCDYSGFIDNEPLGITLLCHPENFRESWMHARNYGLVAANAFGRKAMKKGGSSKVIIRQGETLQLRYGILLHGPKPDLNQMHREYVRQTEP